MVFENGLIFAFLAMLFWGIGDFLIQKSTRKIGDVEALAYIGIFGSIILLPFVIKDINLLFSINNLILLIFLGIVTFVIALFNFEALKKGKLSIIDVIIELELPVTIILGYIFLKETLTFFQFSLISLIFLSMVLMATKSFSGFKTKLERGVFIAVIAAVGMGLINFLTAVSAKNISPIMAIWFPWILVSFICFIYILKREGLKKFVKNGIKYRYLIFSMSLFDTLAWLFYAFAVSKNNISIITAITESYPAIALFFGVYFNKEKIKYYQYIGAFLALIVCFILAVMI